MTPRWLLGGIPLHAQWFQQVAHLLARGRGSDPGLGLHPGRQRVGHGGAERKQDRVVAQGLAGGREQDGTAWRE